MKPIAQHIKDMLIVEDMNLYDHSVAVEYAYEDWEECKTFHADRQDYEQWLRNNNRLTDVYMSTDASGEAIQQETDISFTDYWYTADFSTRVADMKDYLILNQPKQIPSINQLKAIAQSV